MTTTPSTILRDLVLRWNQSFSLVSRQDPRAQTESLIHECCVSGAVLVEELASSLGDSKLHYLDLGTGGGFPGLLWHQAIESNEALAANYHGSTLVEPRSKRAWFLDQAVRAMGLDGVLVLEDSWSPSMVPSVNLFDAGCVVISMKALHLTDAQVLEGWDAFHGGGDHQRIVIVRFIADWSHPADSGIDDLPVTPLSCIQWDRGPGYLVLPYASSRPDSVLLLSVYP